MLFPEVLTNPPQVQSAVSKTDNPDGTFTYQYEMAIPGWNIIDGTGNGTQQALQDDQVIGLSFGFADFESDAEADANTYHAYNSLDGAQGTFNNADALSEFRLLAPGITTTEPTATGTDVATQLTDPGTGQQAATLTFDNVSSSGQTTLTTSSTGPPPPSGFQLGDVPIYYDLSTTATFTGPVEVCLNYDEDDVGDETGLRLFHYESNVWTDVTTSHDALSNTLCGQTETLSPFGIFGPGGGGTLTVSVPDLTAPYATTVQVPVQVTDATGAEIVAVEVFLAFDSTRLTAQPPTLTGGLAASGWSLESNIVAGNGTVMDTVKVAMATDDDVLVGAGNLFQIAFQIDGQRSPHTAPLLLDHVLFNDGQLTTTKVDGSITVIGTDALLTSAPPQLAAREDLTITVTDADENLDTNSMDTFDVALANGAQTETLTLTETANSSGIFSGVIATEFSLTPVSGDDTVQAQAGDLIQTCYTDILDASGATLVRCATSTILGGSDGAVLATVVSQPSDTLRFRVTDPDLNADINVQETAQLTALHSRTGESETVTLTELSLDDNIFFGTVRTTTGSLPGANDDGVLLVQKADSIFALYDDQLTALGAQIVRPDTHQVIDPFGDADGNGAIQAFDAAKVLFHVLNPFITGLDSLAANVDLLAPFGPISPFDAALILQKRVGLIGRFPVQEDEAQNHPQPETDNSTPKPATDERLLTLVPGEGYWAVVTNDRTGILSGDLFIAGLRGEAQMGADLEDYLIAFKTTDNGLRVVFAGAEAVWGDGELLRLYPESSQGEIQLIAARFNDGRLIGRIEENAARVLPMSYALHANIPNPFNPETTIRFELPARNRTRLQIYDMLGQHVRTLIDGDMPVGAHRTVWDGHDDMGRSMASGIYLYRLQAGNFTQTRRMLLLK